jgi:hypothetical protein
VFVQGSNQDTINEHTNVENMTKPDVPCVGRDQHVDYDDRCHHHDEHLKDRGRDYHRYAGVLDVVSH